MAFSLSSQSNGQKSKRRFSTPASALDDSINVTPFVDVLLVLLVIFILTAQFINQGVDVSLPKTKAQDIAEIDNNVAISYKADGTLYLNDKRILLDNLASAMEPYFPEKETIPLLLRADETLDYGDVMIVVARLNRLGFKRMVFLTDDTKEK